MAVDKAEIEMLIDGVLPWPAVQELMREAKDLDRFDKYVEILQERVPWDDQILLPLTPALAPGAGRGSGARRGLTLAWPRACSPARGGGRASGSVQEAG